MLANNLTLDEEDAVQEELKQLQAEIVRGSRRRGIHTRLLSKHPGSRNGEGGGTTVRPSNGTDKARGGGNRRYVHAPPLRASIALTTRRTRYGGTEARLPSRGAGVRALILAQRVFYHHPEKSPNPSLRFFCELSAALRAAGVSTGRFRLFRYFPTPPPPASPVPNAALFDPTLSPNQFTSSFSFSAASFTLVPSALLASFFACRVL